MILELLVVGLGGAAATAVGVFAIARLLTSAPLWEHIALGLLAAGGGLSLGAWVTAFGMANNGNMGDLWVTPILFAVGVAMIVVGAHGEATRVNRDPEVGDDV